MALSLLVGGSGVHWHSNAHLCWNCHCHCEPKDTRNRNAHRPGGLYWSCSDDRHLVDRPHLRSPSEPRDHHRFCCLEALSMEECSHHDLHVFNLLGYKAAKSSLVSFFGNVFGRCQCILELKCWLLYVLHLH